MFRAYLDFVRFRYYFASLALCILVLQLASCSTGGPASSPISVPVSLAISAPQNPVLVGDTGQLSAKITSADGTNNDVTAQATWTTSTPAVVSLAQRGAYSAQSIGTASITATYGGQLATATVSVTDHFTVIAVPDTQRMVAQVDGGSLAMATSEFNWIKDNEFSENIRLVTGEGDIVNSGDSVQEWTNADTLYRILDETTIPYAPVMGNHDYDIGNGMVGADRASQNYNHYFGPQRFAGRPWYGQSTFPAGQGDSFYVTFDVGARHYMVLALEFLPRAEAIAWAQSVLDAHHGVQVILLTHGYLNADASRISVDDYAETGLSYWGLSPATASDGNQLWNELIRKNPSIVAVICGHTWPTQASRDDDDDDLDQTPQLKADFEGDGRGGSGMLRIMKFYPGQNRIDVSSYSPYFDQWLVDPTNQFSTIYGQGTKSVVQRLNSATK